MNSKKIFHFVTVMLKPAIYQSGDRTVEISVTALVVVLNNVILYGAVYVPLDGRGIIVTRTLTNARKI